MLPLLVHDVVSSLCMSDHILVQAFGLPDDLSSEVLLFDQRVTSHPDCLLCGSSPARQIICHLFGQSCPERHDNIRAVVLFPEAGALATLASMGNAFRTNPRRVPIGRGFDDAVGQ